MNLPPLVSGVLIRRYKRFLADVQLEDGRVVVAHCPNPGRMTSCAEPGCRVSLSRSPDPRRKLPWTWEIAYAGASGNVPILVNTARPNAIIAEALSQGQLAALSGYSTIRAEVPYGREQSRTDFLLHASNRPPCYVEVKNVTLLASPGVAAFPDARTERGERHLRELSLMVADGARAVLIFLLARSDAEQIRPADEIDPDYGRALRKAAASGVELIGLKARILPESIQLAGQVPITLKPPSEIAE